MIIASFDIGKKNFAFCVEKVNKFNLNSIPKKKRFDQHGEMTPEYSSLLDQVYKNGELILFDNVDLTVGTVPNKILDHRIYINMIDVLDKYMTMWDQTDVFVIEQQMSFSKRKGGQNTMAMKLAQHLYSYFTFLYRDTKVIYEFPAYYKTQVLGAQKGLTKPQRKKWSTTNATSIFISRNDNESFLKFDKFKKKDDISDTINQLQAFKFLSFVEKVI